MASPISGGKQYCPDESRMTKREPPVVLVPEFVERLPVNSDELVPGIIYICLKYKTVAYRCPCGCGGLSEFVLDPTRFRMTYDGENVTFSPSIGIAYLNCRSHYWIRNNRVEWCPPMQDWEIGRVREREHRETLETRRQQDLRKSKDNGALWDKLAKMWRR